MNDEFDYRASLRILSEDPPFDALILAAFQKADSKNFERLRVAFPNHWRNLQKRLEGKEKEK